MSESMAVSVLDTPTGHLRPIGVLSAQHGRRFYAIHVWGSPASERERRWLNALRCRLAPKGAWVEHA